MCYNQFMRPPFSITGVFGLRRGVEGDPALVAALLTLAHAAVQSEVTGRPARVQGKAATPTQAVFVTIERRGVVVGCRGSLAPRYRSLEEEVIQAARAAAGHDPRYKPLAPTDLKDALVTITVIERLEPVEAKNISQLAPADGLVLTAGSRTGVVLPWEGRDPQTRLRWAYRKAGVSEGSACRLQRLVAQRFRG